MLRVVRLALIPGRALFGAPDDGGNVESPGTGEADDPLKAMLYLVQQLSELARIYQKSVAENAQFVQEDVTRLPRLTPIAVQ
jgi:hypothetical protein